MEDEICRIIEQALELRSGSVTINDGVNTIKKWDSLGLLAILSALEKRFGNRIAALDGLASVRSVQDIVRVLKKEGIVK